jgi:aarF domain-containing kinase
MSGKRVLDAIALFNASRAVASQHLSIRLKQLDVYSKTSTLVKAVKTQAGSTAQVPLSSALRFGSRSSAASSRQTYSSNAGSISEPIPSKESVQKEVGKDIGIEGLEQDHHYKPEDNSVADDVPSEELNVQQEKAKRHPLPDGTIPTGEAAVGKVKTDREVYHERPATEPVKQPLEQHMPSPTSLEPESSRKSSIPNPDSEDPQQSELSSKDAKILQRQSESQIPSKAAEPPGKHAYEVRRAPDDGGAELDVDQERDTFYRAPDNASQVLSALPRVKLPKNMGNVQGGDSHIKEDVNADVFYSSGVRRGTAATSEEQPALESGEPSEEMVDQIFHSPRVSRILGSEGKFGSLKPKHSSSMSTGQIAPVKRKNKDEPNVREGESKAATPSGTEEFTPAPWAKREPSHISALAGDIAQDAGSPQNVS